MTTRFTTILFAVSLLLSGCKTTRISTHKPLTASITEEGLLTCFAPETSLNEKPVWCEASAVLFDGKKLFFANDKDMPTDLSPVFFKTPEMIADSLQLPVFLMQSPFSAGRKYEDFAQTPDRQFILLTTAFDRVKPASTDWDGYNTILYWRSGDEQHPHVLTPDDSSQTSISYRQRIAEVLATNEFPGAIPYFKIEGLAATDKQLLFGIREEGKDYNTFRPVAKIIGVTYHIEKNRNGERIRLADDWKLIASFDIAKAEPTLPKPLALSGLEYDPYRKRFWIITSLEADGQLDAYLWTATPDELFGDRPFTLVRDTDGNPLHVGHKAEDLTFLDKNRVLLIHDDDRVQTKVGSRIRQPNQAAYTVITVK